MPYASLRRDAKVLVSTLTTVKGYCRIHKVAAVGIRENTEDPTQGCPMRPPSFLIISDFVQRNHN